ncbi:DUF4381 domain-containing protein [Psychromonas sp. MME2]|uniref:DUF4381 domain-containing protein n=1 Tax=unclassified Psychromonas TaxID=2614957 RepID=UPI00339CEABA
MSPQANASPLAQLHDVIAPSIPSWWPLAAIYWFLIALVIGLAIASTYLYKKQQQEKQKQQKALQQLRQLQRSNANFVLLNQLLKGVALSYFPRQKVASLHGEQWFEFLHIHAKEPIFNSKEAFVKRLYRNDTPACTDNDYDQAKRWIKNLPVQIRKREQEVNKNV